jgi:hypothetical protein
MMTRRTILIIIFVRESSAEGHLALLVALRATLCLGLCLGAAVRRLDCLPLLALATWAFPAVQGRYRCASHEHWNAICHLLGMLCARFTGFLASGTITFGVEAVAIETSTLAALVADLPA